ncbi:MAG: endonuclease/exonuclease/phosphatase family protein [Candidatus Aminicenantes bacterium]|nr:endonuclease/exonuclease/phosphatase family protein [Candidatus Aminicenantes bacterium]
MFAAFFILVIFAPGIFKTEAGANTSESTINVMSFNIRYDNPGDKDNRWRNRKDMVAGTIRFHKADIAGLQEALHHQVKDLEALLPEYGWFGVGREDGREAGEYSPVFYLKDRFTILHQSTFWLSDTPEKPGKAWDAACPRIVTWGKIEDTWTNKTFFFFNTHFDHMGEIARVKSAELLLKKIDETAGGQPIFLTGDFNCTEKDKPYKILALIDNRADNRTSNLSDAYNITAIKPYGTTQTFNGFQDTVLPARRIDFIFVRGANGVLRYGTISDKWDGRFVSDHNAIFAEISL